MAAVAEVFFRRLSRWQADQQRESVADLYEATYRDHIEGTAPPSPHPYDPAFHDRRAFLTRFADDVQRPGFDMLIATTGTVLVGCIYGYLPDRQGGWWYGRHDIAPREIGQLPDSGKLFTIAELMVAPTHRRRNIAGRLQERLLVRVDADRVTTLIESSNTAAKAAYAAWSWNHDDTLPAAQGRPELEVWSQWLPSAALENH
ncbi:GNAT family N-acetyltransferase [Streptomyces sp. NPDC051561]|uniref:GNAT family N-acetyltransferase n=1 Tax=Streptomyces sp. NPDC051561 TaxID=3365658 RepID=UPI0037989F74